MGRTFTAILALAMLIASCTDNRKRISSKDFGEEWPLTVDGGWIECQGDSFVITFSTDGHRYALNDAARATEKFENISSIVRDDPNYPGGGIKMDVSIIEFEGLKMCNHRDN